MRTIKLYDSPDELRASLVGRDEDPDYLVLSIDSYIDGEIILCAYNSSRVANNGRIVNESIQPSRCDLTKYFDQPYKYRWVFDYVTQFKANYYDLDDGESYVDYYCGPHTEYPMRVVEIDSYDDLGLVRFLPDGEWLVVVTEGSI